MPRGFMDDLEGEVIGEEVHEGALGKDIFSADLNSEDALLPNICEHRVRSVADDLGGFVGGEGIGKVSKPPLHVSLNAPLHSSAMVTKHSPMSAASIGRLLLITTVCLVGLALKIPTGISFRLTDLFFRR